MVSFFSGLPSRIGSALSAVGSRIAGAFRSAASAARGAVGSLISSVVGLFSTLPGRIVASLGNIGSRIVSKIKSGLPSVVRNAIPGLAEGGIVTGPVIAQLGEGGRREVVIPLTKPQRALHLAAASGLLDVLGPQLAAYLPDRSAGPALPSLLAPPLRGVPAASRTPAGVPSISNTFHITEVGDAETTARRVLHRIALTAGV